jgi:hypothetical protein
LSFSRLLEQFPASPLLETKWHLAREQPSDEEERQDIAGDIGGHWR